MAANEAPGRQSDLAVMEANEYKQKRRLERILDAHDRVEDKTSEANELYALGEITHDGKNIMILKVVQQFIREVYNLLVDYDGNIPEDQPNLYWQGAADSPVGIIEMEHGEDVIFRGLRDVLNANDFYREEWEESVPSRHGPNKTETFSRQHSVPEQVSLNAYKLTKMFLSRQHDLELRFENLENDRPLSDWTEGED